MMKFLKSSKQWMSYNGMNRVEKISFWLRVPVVYVKYVGMALSDFLKDKLGIYKLTRAYWEKFIMPQVKRAQELDMEEEMIDDLIHQSIEEARYPSRLPAMLLRDKIDAWWMENETVIGY